MIDLSNVPTAAPSIPPVPVIPGVTFKEVVGAPDYLIGDDGSLLTCRRRKWDTLDCPLRWRTLKASSKDQGGYPCIKLWVGSSRKSMRLHRLVLEAFVGPRPPKMVCRHGNGEPTDNRLSNLSWGTCAQNSADAVRHGRVLSGETHRFAKLSLAQVLQIRSLVELGGLSHKEIGARFGVKGESVRRIALGKYWRNAPEVKIPKGADSSTKTEPPTMDLRRVPEAEFQTEVRRRNECYRDGLCPVCTKARCLCRCGSPLVSVPPVTVREPRVFNGVNPDCRPYRYTPDLSAGTFPAVADAVTAIEDDTE